MSARESRPGRTGAAESFGGDNPMVSDCAADVLDLATMPANEWRAWADGYHTRRYALGGGPR